MDKATNQILGIFLLITGLGLALSQGGNRGFSGDIFSGLAYIGGFVIAFVGAFLAFIKGRTRIHEKDEEGEEE